MLLHIGLERIGTTEDVPAIVPICQIGSTRIGNRGLARNKAGRFVRCREIEILPELPAQEDVLDAPPPPRVRTSPWVKLIALLCVLAACGAWRISTPFALALLHVSGPHSTAALLHIAQRTPSEFQDPHTPPCMW